MENKDRVPTSDQELKQEETWSEVLDTLQRVLSRYQVLTQWTILYDQIDKSVEIRLRAAKK